MMLKLNSLRLLAVMVYAILIGGCAVLSEERPVPGDPQYAPIPPQDLMQFEQVTGAIFQPQRNVNFYGDRVAYNVGDILTVVLSENTSSSKSADTTYDKDDEITFNEANILGTNITGKNLSLLTDPSFERAFDGSASSDQSNSLTGQISVTVAEVRPNGVLRIQGEKWLKLNQGDEYIRLTGLVRPEDIGTDNTIESAKIADARIAYGGTGEFDSTNKKGWFSRFFSSEWWIL